MWMLLGMPVIQRSHVAQLLQRYQFGKPMILFREKYVLAKRVAIT